MGKGLEGISANNSLDFYLDSKNIYNQELVRETISHFEAIRKNIFTPLEFLNLLRKQFYFVLENIETPLKALETLKALVLSPIQKHILYFFIIKWHGGVGSLNPNEAFILRLIEDEFKKYKENTPEKELYFSRMPKIYRFTFEEMELIRLDFDKLTYPQKLNFWDENIKNDIDIYTISSVGFYRENEIKELGIVSDSSISIYPKDKVELEQHNRWLFNHIQSDKTLRNCHFEDLKESYFETIKNNPRAIEYTEQAISAIIKQRDTEKKYCDEKRSISLWGYYWGYQSVVKKENLYMELGADKFKKIGVSYAEGIAGAHYLGFLEKQLEKLKKGEAPVTIEQAMAESSEDEWKNEAKKKGLRAGTLPYIRFINNKKAELKVIEDEKKRKIVFADFVDQSKHWRNTLEDFKIWVKTDKATLSDKNFLLKLRDEYEVQYSNALYYYTIYGPDYLRIEYEKIKGYIRFLQEDIIDKIDKEKGQSNGMSGDSKESLGISNIQNNFDTSEIDLIYNHFKKELVEKNYLTDIELLEYMSLAFDKQVIPKKLFRFKHAPTKQKIMKVFYGYYKDVSGKPHGKQKKYAALLGDYFKGYNTESVSTNFNK